MPALTRSSSRTTRSELAALSTRVQALEQSLPLEQVLQTKQAAQQIADHIAQSPVLASIASSLKSLLNMRVLLAIALFSFAAGVTCATWLMAAVLRGSVALVAFAMATK